MGDITNTPDEVHATLARQRLCLADGAVLARSDIPIPENAERRSNKTRLLSHPW